MRSRERAEIGATRSNDRVHLVGLRYVADGDRRDTGFVANSIAQWRLEHASVYWLCLGRRLPGGDVNNVGACIVERAGDFHSLRTVDSPLDPIGRRDAH